MRRLGAGAALDPAQPAHSGPPGSADVAAVEGILDRQQGGRIPAELDRRHETLILAPHDVAPALAHADRIVLDAPANRLDPARLKPFDHAA